MKKRKKTQTVKYFMFQIIYVYIHLFFERETLTHTCKRNKEKERTTFFVKMCFQFSKLKIDHENLCISIDIHIIFIHILSSNDLLTLPLPREILLGQNTNNKLFASMSLSLWLIFPFISLHFTFLFLI